MSQQSESQSDSQSQRETTPNGQPAIDDPVDVDVWIGPQASRALASRAEDASYLIVEAIEATVHDRTDLVKTPNDEAPDRAHEHGVLRNEGNEFKPRVPGALIEDLGTLVDCGFARDRSHAIRRSVRDYLDIEIEDAGEEQGGGGDDA